MDGSISLNRQTTPIHRIRLLNSLADLLSTHLPTGKELRPNGHKAAADAVAALR